MEFQEWSIDDNEIIGIGPVMIREYPDPDTRLCYDPRQVYFKLILRYQVIEINSDWINTKGIEVDKYLKGQSYLNEFKADHKKIKSVVHSILMSRIIVK